MSHSTFGSSFAQTFQQSMAAARQAADDDKREKRMEAKMLEQRAYGTMEDTKKEARSLGATASELATYNGAENQHALNLLMEDLRTQNKEGRRFAQGGGVRQPDSMLPEEQSSAYSKGFQDQTDVTADLRATSKLEAELAAERSGTLAEAARADAGFELAKTLETGRSFDLRGNVPQQLKDVEEQKAFDKRYVTAGGTPQFDGAEHVDAPTAADYGRLAGLERVRGLETAKEVVTGQIVAGEGARRAIAHADARARAMEMPGQLPPDIRLGYDEGDPALVRHFKNLDEQKFQDNQFFSGAGQLIPSGVKDDEDGNPIWDKSGLLTEEGRAYARANVKMRYYGPTEPDPVTGISRQKQRLEFVRPVPEHSGGGGGAPPNPVAGTGGGKGGTVAAQPPVKPVVTATVNAPSQSLEDKIDATMLSQGVSDEQNAALRKILGAKVGDVSGNFVNEGMRSLRDSETEVNQAIRSLTPWLIKPKLDLSPPTLSPKFQVERDNRQAEADKRRLAYLSQEADLNQRLHQLKIYKDLLSPPRINRKFDNFTQ